MRIRSFGYLKMLDFLSSISRVVPVNATPIATYSMINDVGLRQKSCFDLS
ncbi:unnamed protein product [Haemonchus placei]|uniref:Uncharacterized protein n=1 Tax=Haemonchus placei TaxID=6290 RepID=A0A3P7TX27_HAEPC|nr:unnamed protein product [Haemonchus placei]